MRSLTQLQTKALFIVLIAIWLTGCQKEPIASFTVDQNEGISPLTVNFMNTSTDAVRYEWTFGDGTSSEEIDPVHTFSYDPDEFKQRYGVKLTAYGSNGEINSFSKVINAKKNVQTNNPKITDLDIMVDTTVMHYFEEPFICGLSMAIIDGDDTHIYHYGETTHGNGNMPSETTLYKIASVTKTFTAISLIYWLNQQDISLDAPVKDYLPEDLATGLSKDSVDITFRQMLNHTSGLPFHLNNAPRNDPYAKYDSTDLYELINSEVIVRTPGTIPSNYDAWYDFYSNTAFALLGVLLERNCKMNLQEIFNETILVPFNMNDTEISYIENLPNAASGNNKYSLGNNYSPRYAHLQGIYGAGGLASNLADLIKYARNLIGADASTGLGAAVVESFEQQYEVEKNPSPGKRLFQCLPWEGFLLDNGDKFVFHGGGAYGYTTLFSLDVQNERAMIILNNNYHEDNDFGGYFNGLRNKFYSSEY